MTIDEAQLRIENFLEACEEDELSKKDAQAMRLGIEALERIQAIRVNECSVFTLPLPGETEE